MEKLREKFLRSYANLPDSLKDEIIAIIDDKTFTWKSSYFEVKNDTELSKKILNTLYNLGII